MASGVIKSACPYCGVGCGVCAEQSAEGGVQVTGDTQHPANRGGLCVKGSALAESLAIPSRLLYPRIDGEEVDWDAATDYISEQMAAAIREHGPDSVALYVSGQILTEDYYVANKLMKGYVGSANIDTNSRLCMSSAVAAHIRAFGEDLVPVCYDDLAQTDLLVITGANTAWTHPIIFRRIQQAREQNPNLKVVVIDPRKTVTAEQADLHLPIASDGDVCLYNGLLHYCISHQLIDKAFIQQHTNGWEALEEELMQAKYQLGAVSDSLQIESGLLNTFFRWFATSPRVISLFCQGYNQAENGVDKGSALINAHLVTGKIGQPGSGPFSITGQPNAMGGREVGGLANQLAVHRGFDVESIRQVADYWQAPAIATEPGLKAVELFDAVAAGQIKFLWVIATNPAVSMPNADKVCQAMANCDCVVVSDITAQTDTAAYADVLLPAAGWGEKAGMVTNSERCMTRQRPFIAPPGAAKADWQALAAVGERLCERLGYVNGFSYRSVAEVFREYAGLTGINKGTRLRLDLSALQTLTDEAYEAWVPQQWPLGDGAQSPVLNGEFPTESGRANLVVTSTETIKQTSSFTRQWWLNTGRTRDQWHTMTRTGYIAHLAAAEVEPTVYCNQLSAEHAGLQVGQLVQVSAAGRATDTTIGHRKLLAKLAIDNGLSYKQLFMSMHWAGRYAGASQVNRIVAPSYDPISGQPAYKSAPIDIQPARVGCYGLVVGQGLLSSDGEILGKTERSKLDFVSYQQGDARPIWRFAHAEWIDKSQLVAGGATRGAQLGQRKQLVLDQPNGYLVVSCSSQPVSIVGAISLISRSPVQSSVERLSQLVGHPLDLGQLLNILSAESGTASRLVCSCFRVTEQQIMAAIEANREISLDQLQAQLKCGTNCGSCLPEVSQLLAGSPSLCGAGDLELAIKAK